MRLPTESAPIAALNRVMPVGRADPAAQVRGLRTDDAVRGPFPFARPDLAQLAAQDVALFEQLVYGDAPHLRAGVRSTAAMVGEGASAPAQAPSDVQPADRIAATLRHLGRIRGL
jgi:hypothetical protein